MVDSTSISNKYYNVIIENAFNIVYDILIPYRIATTFFCLYVLSINCTNPTLNSTRTVGSTCNFSITITSLKVKEK